ALAGPAVGSGGGTREGLEIVLEFVGIVGESLEIFTLQDDGAGVAGGIGVERGGSLIVDHNFFFADFEGQGGIEFLRLSGDEGDGGIVKGGESLRDYFDGVFSGSEIFGFVDTIAIGGDGDGLAGGSGDDYGGVGDGASGWVGDLAAQRGRGGLCAQRDRREGEGEQ